MADPYRDVGGFQGLVHDTGQVIRADTLATRLPRQAWQRLSADSGAKGQRYYDWAFTTLTSDRPGWRWLLVRRHRRTRELAFYRCHAPGPVPLAGLVHVAGRRWTIEENFQATKTLTGLDEHQVRCWASWHRWVTLSMVAAAFLTVAAAAERHRNLTPPGQIPLTRNEIARLFTALALQPTHSRSHWLSWSHWRRRHQHRAMQCHYQHQAAQDP